MALGQMEWAALKEERITIIQTFCDLIISGLIGLRPMPDNSLVINPLLSDNTWNYFCLDNILYHGKIITVIYDKTGKKYNKGKGLQVLIDGKSGQGAAFFQKGGHFFGEFWEFFF